jgi:hypothetical protein
MKSFALRDGMDAAMAAAQQMFVKHAEERTAKQQT